MTQNANQTPKPCDAPCDVYSRIVGYYSPVSRWNKGKQEEFRERRSVNINNQKENPMTTKAAAALGIVRAIADTVKELREVPSGTLYSNLMAQGMTLQQYETVLDILKKARVIEVTPGHLVRWIAT